MLREYETNELVNNIFSFFDTPVSVPRIKVGFKSMINTLINEEAFVCEIRAKSTENMEPENCTTLAYDCFYIDFV